MTVCQFASLHFTPLLYLSAVLSRAAVMNWFQVTAHTGGFSPVVVRIFEQDTELQMVQNIKRHVIVCVSQLHIPLRLLCGGLLFTCNAVMWTFLAKALRYSSSSTRTTVTTTASNFISSVSNGLPYAPFPFLSSPADCSGV